MAEDRQNRRYPQNLQGVLQLAVEAGSAAEGPAPVEPMSEEVSGFNIHFNSEKTHTLIGSSLHKT